MTERVVRYVDLTPSQGDSLPFGTSVDQGHHIGPPRIHCPQWLAITRLPDPRKEEQFLIYFLFVDGRIIDFLQRDTLEEAMDEVGGVVLRKDWRSCSVDLEEDTERIPRHLIP
jgi:hypothetical protein